MTYGDILTLLRAGYTKEEIDAMKDGPSPTDPAPTDPEPAADPQPAEDPQPAAQPETPPDPTQQVLSQITELIKAVQANNRSSADMGAEIIEPKQQALSTLRSLGGIPENQD